MSPVSATYRSPPRQQDISKVEFSAVLVELLFRFVFPRYSLTLLETVNPRLFVGGSAGR